MSTTPVRGRAPALAALLALAAALLSAPAAEAASPSAARAELRDRAEDHARERLADLRASGGGGAPLARPRDAGEFADPADDTVRIDVAAETTTPEARADADLREVAITAYGRRELSLSATTAAPAQALGTQDGSVTVTWALDGDGDGVPDAVAALVAAGGEAVALLLAGDEAEEALLCEGVARVDGTTYAAQRFPSGCVDRAPQLSVAVELLLDPAGDGGSDVLYADAAPDQAPSDSGGAEPAPLVTFGPVARDDTDVVRTRLRLAGAERIATAVAISRARFATAEVVYLATGANYPDALAAGHLPGGPTLLVPTCGALPEILTAELGRLAPRSVVVLGGTAAVCDEVAAAAVAAAGPQAAGTRVGGADRYTTAVFASQAGFPSAGGVPARVPTVVIATGEDFPDALAAGTLDGGPLLLVPSCGAVPQVVLDEVARVAPLDVVALGGDSAICPEVLAAVAAAAQEGVGGASETATVTASRLAGPDRFATAVAISRARFPGGAVEVSLATASAFPDALAGGSARLGPILLVPACGAVPAIVLEEVARLDPSDVIALGGESAVPEGVLRQVATGQASDDPRCGEPEPPVTSFGDLTGDVYDRRAETFGARPAGDLVDTTVRHEEAVELTARVAAPADPQPGSLVVTWVVDVPGGELGEYSVDFFRNATGSLDSAVFLSTGSNTVLCRATPSFVDGTYRTSFDARCIGAPSELSVLTSVETEDERFFDFAPNDAADGPYAGPVPRS